MAEKSIELDSVEIAAAVFGNCDRNIRMLEKEFSVTAVCRGTMLRISGEPANVAAAARAVEGMLLLIENHTPLEDQTVRYCLSLAHDGEEKRVRELTEDFVTVTVIISLESICLKIRLISTHLTSMQFSMLILETEHSTFKGPGIQPKFILRHILKSDAFHFFI